MKLLSTTVCLFLCTIGAVCGRSVPTSQHLFNGFDSDVEFPGKDEAVYVLIKPFETAASSHAVALRIDPQSADRVDQMQQQEDEAALVHIQQLLSKMGAASGMKNDMATGDVAVFRIDPDAAGQMPELQDSDEAVFLKTQQLLLNIRPPSTD